MLLVIFLWIVLSDVYPVAELLLEKMQIVNITEKDLKDSVILLAEHDIGDTDNETINGKHIASILSKDWGFSYTVTTNLQHVKEYADKSPLGEADNLLVKQRIARLLDIIEKAPKSLRWTTRARIGTKKKWYQDVEELRIGGEFERELAKHLNKKK